MSRLAQALADAPVPRSRVRLWGLGQAGTAIRGAGLTVLIDPYLSDWLEQPSEANPEPATRATPARIGPDDIPVPDLVLCTHEHPDHLDPGTIPVLARRSGTTRFVVPEPLRQNLLDLDVDDERIVGVLADEPVDVDGVEILALPAPHAMHPDAFGGYTWWLDDRGRHRSVGFAVTLDGVRLFHAGDTVYWPGMDERLRSLGVDVALLPINGRSWARERDDIVGNLTAREAAELAAAAEIPLTIPMHFDGIVGNTADPAAFVEHLRAIAPERAWALPDDDAGLVVPR